MGRRAAGETPAVVTGLFVLLGVTGLVLAAVHVWFDADALWAEALDALILVSLSLTLFYEAHEVRNARFSLRKGMWVFLGAFSAGMGVALLATSYILVRNVTGSPLGEDWYIVFAGWLVGLVVGSPAFRYYSQLEAELAESRELNKQLRVSQRALRHNLRNELSVILGHVDDLTAESADAETYERLRVVDRHLERLVSLSDHAQLLGVVWDTDAVQTFGLRAVVEKSERAVRVRHPEVELTVEVDDLSVVAHERFVLAVTEAIENAVKHTPEDTAITVSATVEGEWVRLVVADTGTGIADLDVIALDQPSETPMSHGRGLGLWLIYWVLEKSGGAIAFEPNEPRGTRVVMRLPRVA